MNNSELKRLVLNKFQSLSRKILKEQSEDRKKKDTLHLLEEEVETFKEFLDRDTTQLQESLPRCRALVEATLRIFLQYFSMTSQEKSFPENVDTLTHLVPSLDASIEPSILPALVTSVRFAGRNKVSNGHKEFLDNEVNMTLFSTIYVLELFYLGILLDHTGGKSVNGVHREQINIPTLNVVDGWENKRDRPQRQIDIQKEFNMPLEDTVLETLQQLPVFNISPGISPISQPLQPLQKEHILIPLKKEFSDANISSKKGEIKSESPTPKASKQDSKKEKKGKQVPQVEEKGPSPRQGGPSPRQNGKTTPPKPEPNTKSTPVVNKNVVVEKHEKKDEKKDDGEVKLVPFNECKFLPCVRKACGVTCGLNHEHSDSKRVFLSYGKIGSENCLHGPNCNKYKKLITLKDGRTCNECPFLHDTKDQDDCKKRIGLGWKLYAAGVITYDQIFTSEKLHMQ